MTTKNNSYKKHSEDVCDPTELALYDIFTKEEIKKMKKFKKLKEEIEENEQLRMLGYMS